MNKKLIRKMQTAAGESIKRLKDGYRYIPDEQNGGWNRISDNSMADVFATMEFTPKKTKVGSSITRKQSAPSKTYYSAYNPDDIIKGFNILTLGGLNNLSPTLWARRVYDTGKLLTGNMTWSGYTNSWINGNNGLVSLEFSEKHPHLSAGINLVGDVAALGGISGAKKLTNISKPNVNVTADIGTTAKQGTTTLSLEEIEKAFNQARQWHLNRINSPGYTNRALRAGFTEEEIPQLLQLLTNLINRLKLQRPEEVLGSNIKLNHNLNGKPSAGYWKTNLNGNLKQGISFYNTNVSYDDAVSNFIHEFGHGATFGLNGTETSGYMKALADQFPLINRVVKYNKSLYPEINAGRVEQAVPGAMRTGNIGYFASPTEMLSRGYEFMRDYGNNWIKAYKSGELPSKTHQDLVGNRANSNIFNIIATPKGAANFLKNALGISVPLGLGGYGLYGNNNLLQQLQYLKQGGKMNILEFLKNGSGIHIKKENKGKFTDYCGGKVTSSCIAKGKNSSDPAVRKRATFADNARHFKHLEGGVLKALEGSKVDPLLINGLANGIMNFATTFALNKVLDSLAKALKALNEQEWSLTVKEIIKLNQLKRALNFKQWMSDYQQGLTLDNPSLIVANHFGYNELQNEISEGKNTLKNKNALIDAQTTSLKSSGWIDAFGGLALTGLSLLGNKLSSTGEKSSSNKSTNVASNYLNNTLDFWNNPSLSGNNSFKTNSYLYNPDKFWNL